MNVQDGGRPAVELVGLLGRIASDPRRTDELHRLLGGYCHDSRNILNSLKMCLYLGRRSGGACVDDRWVDVEACYGEIEWFIDRLHQLCRPTPLTPVRAPLDLLFEERREVWSRDLEAWGRRLALAPPTVPAEGSFDPMRLGAALDDLVAWRARRGIPGADLRVSWASIDSASALEVCWSERTPGDLKTADTAGGQPAARPGQRDSHALDLLCLPMLTRIVTLHGGTVETSERDGWRLRMHWPTSPCTSPGVIRPC
jgi:hypothetical protein